MNPAQSVSFDRFGLFQNVSKEEDPFFLDVETNLFKEQEELFLQNKETQPFKLLNIDAELYQGERTEETKEGSIKSSNAVSYLDEEPEENLIRRKRQKKQTEQTSQKINDSSITKIPTQSPANLSRTNDNQPKIYENYPQSLTTASTTTTNNQEIQNDQEEQEESLFSLIKKWSKANFEVSTNAKKHFSLKDLKNFIGQIYFDRKDNLSASQLEKMRIVFNGRRLKRDEDLEDLMNAKNPTLDVVLGSGFMDS